MAVEDLHEARHVRALEVVGRYTYMFEVGDGVLLALAAVLDAHRVADVLDANAVDRDAARVRAALHVGDGLGVGGWLGCCLHRGTSTRPSAVKSARVAARRPQRARSGIMPTGAGGGNDGDQGNGAVRQ